METDKTLRMYSDDIQRLCSSDILQMCNSDPFVKGFVAMNRLSPKIVLETLSKDKSPAIRYRVAKNDSTPVETVTELSMDGNDKVRDAAVEALSTRTQKSPTEQVDNKHLSNTTMETQVSSQKYALTADVGNERKVIGYTYDSMQEAIKDSGYFYKQFDDCKESPKWSI
jgi:hypothetical protein